MSQGAATNDRSYNKISVHNCYQLRQDITKFRNLRISTLVQCTQTHRRDVSRSLSLFRKRRTYCSTVSRAASYKQLYSLGYAAESSHIVAHWKGQTHAAKLSFKALYVTDSPVLLRLETRSLERAKPRLSKNQV